MMHHPIRHRRRRFRDTEAAQLLFVAGGVLVAAALSVVAFVLIAGAR